jgi:hypothetical protein
MGVVLPSALAVLLCLASAVPAAAQIFLASRPHPVFKIGPLFIRARVTPEIGAVPVDVQWSVEIPADRSALGLEQDLFLLWPGAVRAGASDGKPDPSLRQYLTRRGFSVLAEGRLPLHAQSLYQVGDDLPTRPVAGGAPYVTFVQAGGAFGLSAPATYIRIPWTLHMANRAWIMNLQITAEGLIKPKQSTWIETVFRGPRFLFTVTYNDVRPRAVFPVYFEHRDRVVRLADAPTELVVSFARADELQVDDVYPQSSTRRLSESLDSTEVVSSFLEKSGGITPQQLTVQFGYFSGLRALGPVVIPALFFVLGNVAAVLVRHLAGRVGQTLVAHVHLGRAPEAGRRAGVILSAETLARITPDATTYDEVLRLCGPDAEQQEQRSAPGRRTLVYRGRRVVPRGRRVFSWFSTVSHWVLEDHTVQIDFDESVVKDVQANIRRSRIPSPAAA